MGLGLGQGWVRVKVRVMFRVRVRVRVRVRGRRRVRRRVGRRLRRSVRLSSALGGISPYFFPIVVLVLYLPYISAWEAPPVRIAASSMWWYRLPGQG